LTPERRETIVLLLSSKWDAIHTPPLSRAEQSAKRGEVGTLKVPCPNCSGDGELQLTKFGMKGPCVRCGGFEIEEYGKPTGYERGCGYILVDEYTEREPSPSEGRSRDLALQTFGCDRCGGSGVSVYRRDVAGRLVNTCEACYGSGRRELLGGFLRSAHPSFPAPDDAFDDPKLVAEHRHRASGSYDALDDGLRKLAVVMPVARRMLFLVYESGQLREGDLSAPLRRRLEFGLRYLDRALPRRLRVPRSVREAAARRHVNGETAVRIKSLRFEHGLALFELQVRFSLSRAQVLDVLGRTG
jgi:hypothetical protein